MSSSNFIKGNEDTGVLAALAAPFCMAIGFILWDKAWNANGSAFALNMFKCNLASLIFVAMVFIFGFAFEDENFEMKSIGWLVLSGIIGIVIGDLAWLEALGRLGAFKVLLIDTFKPFAAAFFGHLILDESIHAVAYAGIILTAFGVLMVSLEQNKRNIEKNEGNDQEKVTRQETTRTTIATIKIDDGISSSISAPKDESDIVLLEGDKDPEDQNDSSDTPIQENESCKKWHIRNGYILAFANVLLDTYGSLLTKQHGTNFTTWAINLIRFGSSGVLMLLLSISMHIYHKQNPFSPRNKWYQLPKQSFKSWFLVIVGVVFVTFLCPALSNYALFQIALALALTLGSITPLYALFLEWGVYGPAKKPTFLAFIGSLLAIAGVVVLALFNSNQ